MTVKQQKIAVVLMNLGGPSGYETIEPFLFNFFMDRNIIKLPQPFRWMIAKWISKTRSKGAALDAYSKLNGISPLLDNTKAQADALQQLLATANDGAEYKVFVSMRYWHPMASDVIRDLREFGATKLILLPLYPQFSTTTSHSSFENWAFNAALQQYEIPTYKICCYPVAEGFISASADQIRKQLEKAPPGTRILFSAHGLPEKVIKDGDPYQWQCEQTAQAIVNKLAIAGLDWEICYQSRVGPMKWIGPSTEEALQKAALEKKGVIIYPHAFVSEHVETLVEIDMEYREKADHMGIPYFAKAETVGVHPDFIRALYDIAVNKKSCSRICPAKCKRCGCKV